MLISGTIGQTSLSYAIVHRLAKSEVKKLSDLFE